MTTSLFPVVGFLHYSHTDAEGNALRTHTEVAECPRCGSLVTSVRQEDHDRWHTAAAIGLA